eukprot:CAMPEP_0197027232 /NCGR_PEP_ID=MMETSP1384-20130603/7181_1 /TAXON_ID=29189 /ORGANISM="Ammonia sp." /LENGTH=400 /DNA_ID=CAMNT_0042456045 /DNA_START=35 /DNA_END=1237 /DNA_ORIENTATION=-
MTVLTKLHKSWYLLLVAVALCRSEQSCDNSSIPESCKNLTSSNVYIACRAVSTLQSEFYDTLFQQWRDDGHWWNIANTVESLINYCANSRLCDQQMIDLIEKQTNKHTRRIKQGYDDIQWWSLTLIRLHELLGNSTYLQRAIRFYDYVWDNAWDNSTCQGGLWWNTGKTYKNAITNELGLTNTAKLYKLTQDDKYLQQFNLIWSWFYKHGNSGVGMINPAWLINDGLRWNSTDPQQCVNNHGVEWTYNQGVILGGLSEMYPLNRDAKYVNISWNIIQSVMAHLTTSKNGIEDILHEQASDESVVESQDQSQFKGIFMRYLMYFYQNVVAHDDEKDTGMNADMKAKIEDFVNDQLTAISENSMNPKCYAEFSAVWNASWVQSEFGAVAQVTAIDAFNWAFL